MDIFGIGPLEFLFVIVIILMIAGPKDIGRGARALGRGLNRLYRSSNYQMVRRISQEIRNLPARLAEEAQLDELKEVAQLKELKEAEKEVKAAARGISDLNRQEMQAWTEDLSATDKADPKPAPPKPATKPVTPPTPKPPVAAAVKPTPPIDSGATNTIGAPPATAVTPPTNGQAESPPPTAPAEPTTSQAEGAE